jgi:cell division protein FtsB
VHLAGEVKKLKRKTGQLKAANAALVDENQKLADAIEKLKLLEFMLEEKRRSLQ